MSEILFTDKERARYARHLILPQVGEEGQKKNYFFICSCCRSGRLRISSIDVSRSGWNRENRNYRR